MVVRIIFILVMMAKNIGGNQNFQDQGKYSTPQVHDKSLDEDSIRAMKKAMLGINLDAKPDLKYYQLVIVVENAVDRGLITPIARTYRRRDSGIETELYKAAYDKEEILLPSITVGVAATNYLARRRQRTSSTRKTENARHTRINYIDESKRIESCALYKGLLHGSFPASYNSNPVRDMKIDNLEINFDSEPGETYYALVIKVNAAVQNFYLVPVPLTSSYGDKGIHTQIYRLDDNSDHRFPSHRDLYRARYFLNNKLMNECGAFLRTDHSSKTKTTKQDSRRSRYCYTPNEIKHFETDMQEIGFDSVPGKEYYNLVLKVNRAVYCNWLIVVDGTLSTGVKGIRTEMYKLIQDDKNLRLASIKDVPQARAFFHLTKDDQRSPKDSQLVDFHMEILYRLVIKHSYPEIELSS